MSIPSDKLQSQVNRRLSLDQLDDVNRSAPTSTKSRQRIESIASVVSTDSESQIRDLDPPSSRLLSVSDPPPRNDPQLGSRSAPKSLKGRVSSMSPTAKRAGDGFAVGGVLGASGAGVVSGLAGAGVIAGGAATVGKFLLGGMGLGAVIGGPIGAAIGAAVGVVVGGLVVGGIGAAIGALVGKLRGGSSRQSQPPQPLSPQELGAKYAPGGSGFEQLAREVDVDPETDLTPSDRSFISATLREVQSDSGTRKNEAALRSYTKQLIDNLAAARSFVPPDGNLFERATENLDLDTENLSTADHQFIERLLQQRSRDYAGSGLRLDDGRLTTLAKGLAAGLSEVGVSGLSKLEQERISAQLREALGAKVALGQPIDHQRVSNLVRSLVGGMQELKRGVAKRESEAKEAGKVASELGLQQVEKLIDLPETATTEETMLALGKFLPPENETKKAHDQAKQAAQEAARRLLDPDTTPDQMAEALSKLIQRAGQYTTARFQTLNGIRAGIGKGNKEYGNAEFEEDTQKLLKEALAKANVSRNDAGAAYKRLMGPNGLARRFRFAGALILADHRLATNENISNVAPKLMRAFGNSMLALAQVAEQDKQRTYDDMRQQESVAFDYTDPNKRARNVVQEKLGQKGFTMDDLREQHNESSVQREKREKAIRERNQIQTTSEYLRAKEFQYKFDQSELPNEVLSQAQVSGQGLRSDMNDLFERLSILGVQGDLQDLNNQYSLDAAHRTRSELKVDE